MTFLFLRLTRMKILSMILTPFFMYMTPLLVEEIQSQLTEKNSIKWYLVSHVILNSITQECDYEFITAVSDPM